MWPIVRTFGCIADKNTTNALCRFFAETMNEGLSHLDSPLLFTSGHGKLRLSWSFVRHDNFLSNGRIWQYLWKFNSSKYLVLKLRCQTEHCINQLETNTRSTAKYPACTPGPTSQVWLSGLDASCGEPKGVELGISYIATYKDSLVFFP